MRQLTASMMLPDAASLARLIDPERPMLLW
jgi:hypothetical protein